MDQALSGGAAPPRRNGELVFEAPWHSRAFGMAVGLHQQGLFTWPEFQQHLIARIAAWEDQHGSEAEYDYYALWLAALEDLLVEKRLADGAAIASLAGEIAARPPEADHHHSHDHGHHHDH
ncbi:MAG: nitrile hydratase accessory protein [Gammaproteobacteria bacterium]|nr:nitrile hydratase accessory protein [Gammaproteobacteria bacterium]